MTEESIAAEIAALRRLKPRDLGRRFQELWGYKPSIWNRMYRIRRCAWKLQEQRHGGLSAQATERLEALITAFQPADGDARTGRDRLPRSTHRDLEPGTILIRDYKGERIRVTVREAGFAWAGTVYPSLSAVAKAVTGAKWNGRLFFHLSARKKPS